MKTKNLTLAEAIKTGLPFRKNTMIATWLTKDDVPGISFEVSDLVLSCWEVKREPREWEMWASESGNLSLTPVTQWSKIKVREVIEND